MGQVGTHGAPMNSPDVFVKNQHSFSVIHISEDGKRWGECSACRLIVSEDGARDHVLKQHAAVVEEMPDED